MGRSYDKSDWRRWVGRAENPIDEGAWVAIHLNIHCHHLMKVHGPFVVFEMIGNRLGLRFSKNARLSSIMSPTRYKREILGRLTIHPDEVEELGLERRTRYTLERAGTGWKTFALEPHSAIPYMTPLRLPVPAISVY